MTKRLAAPPACWTKCFWPVVHVSKMGCAKVSRFSASDSNSWTGFGGSNLLEGILTKGMTMSSRGCNRVLTGEDGPLEVLDVFIVEILPVWVAYMHMMWTFLLYSLTKTTTSHHYQGNVWYTVEKRSSWAALWTNWFNMSAFPKTWIYNGLAKMRSSVQSQ